MDNCPNCKKSLIGEEIPDKYKHHYGTSTHYKLEIGMEYPELYDGVWEYCCPFCEYKWPSEAQLARRPKNGTNA